MARDTQRRVGKTAVKKKKGRVETEKSDDADNKYENPADRLAQKGSEPRSAPGSRRRGRDRQRSFIGRHKKLGSMQEDLLVFFLFFRELLGVEIVHLDKLDFISIGERWINAYAVDELALFRERFHIIGTEEIVDESFAGVGMGRFRG